MATIKKAFVDIVELLQANEDARVGDILPSVIELTQAKTGAGGGKASTFHRNEQGDVVAIKCYYHGLWMDPRVADFGKKATSPTGLNNLCKDGMSKWTKQQREAKATEAELLTRVAEGELAPEDIPAEQERIKEEAKRVEPREDVYGFETLEECLADSAERFGDE